MITRKFSKRAGFTIGVLAVAMGTAACGTDKEESAAFYCADATGKVVDEKYCDDPDSGGSFFIWYHGTSVYNGTYLPGSYLPAGGQKIPINDKAGRARLGLPTSGKIGNGTVKTGILGKGGAATGGKAGGGAKSGG